MSPSSSSKLSQLVSAIKSSDPVRTRALCDDITFDINDAVECDSDGEDDFPLQVALGKRTSSAYICLLFAKESARALLSLRVPFCQNSLVFSPSLPSKRRKRSARMSFADR